MAGGPAQQGCLSNDRPRRIRLGWGPPPSSCPRLAPESKVSLPSPLLLCLSTACSALSSVVSPPNTPPQRSSTPLTPPATSHPPSRSALAGLAALSPPSHTEISCPPARLLLSPPLPHKCNHRRVNQQALSIPLFSLLSSFIVGTERQGQPRDMSGRLAYQPWTFLLFWSLVSLISAGSLPACLACFTDGSSRNRHAHRSICSSPAVHALQISLFKSIGRDCLSLFQLCVWPLGCFPASTSRCIPAAVSRFQFAWGCARQALTCT